MSGQTSGKHRPDVKAWQKVVPPQGDELDSVTHLRDKGFGDSPTSTGAESGAVDARLADVARLWPTLSEEQRTRVHALAIEFANLSPEDVTAND